MTKAFASWSGGKDCCLALYRALKQGLDVHYLFNMVGKDSNRSKSHGVRAAVIKEQAKAMGIPIMQQPTTNGDYEEVFTKALQQFNKEGIEVGVFGDIDFEPHREWNERVCKPAGITAQLPLWQEDQTKLLEEFLAAGFKSVVIAVKADLMGQEFLGRIIDKQFIEDIAKLNKGITPCGEAGEFHSLVVDGPIFKKRLELTKTEVVTRQEHHFLEILETKLVDK
jgi:diphthine-ammonia ligase